MRIVGVVAEYNPFHLGHAYHLAEIRRRARADAVVVVMSSVFTQRGDAALLPPTDRARMALMNGADAVFALPAIWSVRDAENFAMGGVGILAGLGCNILSFGSEDVDLSLIRETARLLEQPDEDFSADLQRRMSGGKSYPMAVASALESRHPGSGRLLCEPNSTLAVCYLRAIIRLGVDMEVLPIRRIGSYHATEVERTMPSATAVRGAVIRGDWSKTRTCIPENIFEFLRGTVKQNRLHRPSDLDRALLYQLRRMTEEDYAALPYLSEGIEHRLQNASQTARSRVELLHLAKTRRYPYARLSRLATYALLGIDGPLLSAEKTPHAAWLLGFRKEQSWLLSYFKNYATIPVIDKAADFDRTAPWFRHEMRAYDIWTLGIGMPAGMALTQGVVVV